MAVFSTGCDGGGAHRDAGAEASIPATGDGATDGGLLQVQITSDRCPVVYATASPSVAPIGGGVSLVATGTDRDQDGLAFLWTAPSGRFSSPHAPATDYLCEQGGEQTLTITVADSYCLVEATIPVTCRVGP